jgi:hypothetical protein
MNQEKHPDMNMQGNMNQIRQDMMHMPSCVDHETVIEDVQLAHAYVPFQKFCPTFTPMASLRNGTAFPGLYEVGRWEKKHGMGGEML